MSGEIKLMVNRNLVVNLSASVEDLTAPFNAIEAFKAKQAAITCEISEMFSEDQKGGMVEIDTASLTYDPGEWKRKILEGMPPMSDEMKELVEKHCEAAEQKEAQA